MNGTLNKFRKRNIQANLYQFTLVIFVVAVSVCLISGLFINYITLKKSLNKFYAQSNLPNLWIEVDKVREEGELFLSNFEYSKRYSFSSDFQIGSEKHNSQFLISGRKISTPYIVEGDEGFGCYVDSNFIDKYNVGIGFSKIAIDFTVNNETKQIEFTVMGSLAMAEDLLKDDNCVIFIDEKVFLQTLKMYFNSVSETDYSLIEYNQVLIKSQVTSDEKNEIQNYFEHSSTNLVSIKTQNDIDSFVILEKELAISKTMLWLFPILFVIISMLVIISSISQLVIKERYNIGLLKSFGFSDKTLVSNYSGYGGFVCLFGAVLGFLVSPLIVPNITFETYDKLYNLPRDEVKMSIPIWLVLIVLVVAVLIGYLSAYFACLKITKETPKECMSGKTKINLKSRKKSKKTHGIFGGAINNIKINRSRSIMSFVSLLGSLMLIEIGFGVSSSFITSGFVSIKAYSSIFKGFSIVLLLLTIIIFMVQIFKERYREMAMLRIFGEDYVKIWFSIVIEMLVISLSAFVVSCLLCQPIFMLFMKLFGISGKFYVNFMGVLKSFAIILVLEIIVLIIGLIKVYKLNLPDAIKFSE